MHGANKKARPSKAPFVFIPTHRVDETWEAWPGRAGWVRRTTTTFENTGVCSRRTHRGGGPWLPPRRGAARLGGHPVDPWLPRSHVWVDGHLLFGTCTFFSDYPLDGRLASLSRPSGVVGPWTPGFAGLTCGWTPTLWDLFIFQTTRWTDLGPFFT